MEAALSHKRPTRTRAKVLDDRAEMHLVALACSEAPRGRECWTMQLLAYHLVELGIAATVSDETVRTTLKNMNLNPG
jgi:hypothetical protein